MITRWSDYASINENLQKARSILRRNGIEETDETFQKLRKLLSANPGYLGKFTDWLIIDKVPYERLESLYNTIKGARLSKAIDQFATPEEVVDTLVRVNADTAVHQMVMSIPSETRNKLKHGDYCETCECEREEIGQVDCSACDGSGEIECKTCEGQGSKECKRCNGSGETKSGKDCSYCEGSGEIDCKKCDRGSNECSKCKGECTEECPECKKVWEKGTRDWQSLLRFLALHTDKKDLICDFFSKKSGRYYDDFYDYGYEDTIETIKSDVLKLLNMPSIDAILEKSKNDSDIKFIYNDEKILIVAVNFEGVQKYGSSYWCITEDEGTFDSYVYGNETINQQWIIYFRGKSPLSDEESVMGVTYNIEDKEVDAAHWEDDSDCRYEAQNLIDKLKIDVKDIINALEIYSYNPEDMIRLWVKYPDFFKANIENMFVNTKEALKKKEDFEKELAARKGRGRKPSLPYDIERDVYAIIDLITELMEEDGELDKELAKLFKESAHKHKLFIPIRPGSEDDFICALVSDLYQYVDYDLNKNDVNLFYRFYQEDIEQEKGVEILKYYISKGYDVKKYLDSIYAEGYTSILYKLDILSIDDLLNSKDYSWLGDDELAPKVYFHILDNDIRVIDEIYERIISFISKDSNLVTKYKDKILDDINKNRVVGRSMLEYILDSIDDDDIELACARKLLHRKILTKYDVEMRKKMLERLSSFDDFIKNKS